MSMDQIREEKREGNGEREKESNRPKERWRKKTQENQDRVQEDNVGHYR